MSKRKRSVQDNGEIGGDGGKRVKSFHPKSERKARNKEANLRGGDVKTRKSTRPKDNKLGVWTSTTHGNLNATQSGKKFESPSGTTLPPAKPGGSKLKLRAEKKKDRREWNDRIKVKEKKGIRGDLTLRNGQENEKDSKRTARAETDTASSSGAIWRASASSGGYQLNIDPVFSFDEEHILLAYPSAVRVYARSNSLELRVLSTSTHGSIIAFKIPPNKPELVYIALDSGRIELWNWLQGNRMRKWDIKSRIYDLMVSPVQYAGEMNDTVFTIDKTNERWMITAHRLVNSENKKTELQTLYISNHPITKFQALEKAKYIVATGEQRLIIGTLDEDKPEYLKKLSYVWREFRVPEPIVALDARIAESDGTGKRLPGKHEATSLDVVLGGEEGSLYMYRHIASHLIEIEECNSRQPPPVKRLHWHRDGAGDVRWSLDGNYLISGGSETVLVIWQLDTGRKQLLPHLSATIESIVVSHDGSSYAIRLADNSTMIISTSELQPTFNVSGILLPSRSHVSSAAHRHVKSPEKVEPKSIYRRPAVTSSEGGPSNVLLAVPAALPSSVGIPPSMSASYLQTFDPKLGYQISRQALTRTKITDLNTGPDGHVIDEPNVVLLQVSHDGNWLATVEEWIPPFRDLQPSNINEQATLESQTSRTETCLKFWFWSDHSRIWELVTRVENPHASDDSCGRTSDPVLDLVSDPSHTGFVTVGYGGEVRVWRPKARFRGGVPVKGKRGDILTNFECRQKILLPAFAVHQHGNPVSRAAISEDGSLLVIAQQYKSISLLYTIDLRASITLSVRTDAFTDIPVNIGLLNHQLVILTASQLLIWDLVDSKLQYALDLHASQVNNLKRIPYPSFHLSISRYTSMFAVAVPEKNGSRLAVFDFTSSSQGPVFTTFVPLPLSALVPCNTPTGGFYAIDAAGGVHSLKRVVGASIADAAEATNVPRIEQKPRTAGLENIFGKKESTSKEAPDRNIALLKDTMVSTPASKPDQQDGVSGVREIDKTSSDAFDTRLLDAEDDGLGVVRQHDLAELFGSAGQPFGLPTMGSLFEGVAKLILGRDRRRKPVEEVTGQMVVAG